MHKLDGFLEGPCGLIRADKGEGVEAVGDGDDAAYFGDLVFAQFVGVSGAVPFFVVGECDGMSREEARRRILRGAGDDLGAEGGVALNDLKLVRGEFARSVKQVERDVYFSDIVKESGGLKTR